ncbi:hypothetical protein [Anatilimnocola floriformis]|uniref:hypothetical protein n=1 Tax=Anatilimnocola floriformis TaxID=2948575 RepID=UPI0020C2D917|nr:hypothetical protein [Anatilimnocola floriformis]
MSRLPIRVVKIGASLLERPKLPEQLRAWLASQHPAVHILLSGSGELADAILNWDSRFQLGESTCHWLCIETLSISAQVLQQILPEFSLVRSFHELRERAAAAVSPAVFVFDVQQFLREVEPQLPPESLPHTWEVRTDSIAARLVEVLDADELVILKSWPCPDPSEISISDFNSLRKDNFVDEYFPKFAGRIRKLMFWQLPPN